MRKFIREFKTFVMRGNMVDLAIGVIIGAAFQAVVKSLTDNIISPIIGLFMGTNFDEALQIPLFGATLKLGAFLTALINFLIMMLVIFLMVRAMNRLSGRGKKAISMQCPYCLTLIPYGATRCPNCATDLDETLRNLAMEAAHKD